MEIMIQMMYDKTLLDKIANSMLRKWTDIEGIEETT